MTTLLVEAPSKPQDISWSIERSRVFESRSDSPFRRLDGLVEEERLSDILDLGDCALEVECFR